METDRKIVKSAGRALAILEFFDEIMRPAGAAEVRVSTIGALREQRLEPVAHALFISTSAMHCVAAMVATSLPIGPTT